MRSPGITPDGDAPTEADKNASLRWPQILGLVPMAIPRVKQPGRGKQGYLVVRLSRAVCDKRHRNRAAVNFST